MKRIPLLLAVVAMLVLVLAPPAQAQAVNERINERIPVSGTFFNRCTGEEVTFEGTLHLVGNVVKDSSGGLHFKGHINIQARGVSTNGAKYAITMLRNEEFTLDLDAQSASTSTVTLHSTIIRQGEDGTEEDFKAQVVLHVTQNANGELTAEVLTVKVEECPEVLGAGAVRDPGSFHAL